MAQANYPYLDLTVLPELRKHVIAPNAAVLFDRDLSSVLWANGEGTALIGSSAVRHALEGESAPNPAMMRQISAAAEKLDMAEEATAIMRVRSGFKTRLLGFTVRTINLPRGEEAVLLLTENMHGRRHKEDDMARAAVDCLDGHSHASAILDAGGSLIAASEHFETLEVATDDLESLVLEVATEQDRLVKRPIRTKRGDMPAGIARLTDDPASHILVIANTHEIAKADPTTAIEDMADSSRQALASATDMETEASADEIPAIGAFSNKRQKPGGKGLGRWYYKENIDQPIDDEDTDATSEEDAQELMPAGGDLVQETEHTENSVEPDTTLDDAQDDLSDNFSDREAEHLKRAHEEGNDGFRFVAGSKPMRFVWEMDALHEFRSVSGEFAAAVGPKAANIVGLSWEEVSRFHDLDNAEEISQLLEKGDTWSGKTVLWPVQGTDLRVPIDLAGLPSYGRNRNFEGFNGFGIVRTGDAVVDPDAVGMALGKSDLEGDQEAGVKGGASIGFLSGARDKTVEGPDKKDASSSKVVDLEERRSSKSERSLSSDEQETFQEIGEKLTDEPTAKNAETEETPEKHDFVPSAFAGSARKTQKAEKSSTPNGVKTPEHDVDTSILSRLPIPVLVYRDNDLLFGNDEFFKLTGYGNLKKLAGAGGVDALFGGMVGTEGETSAQIFHSNGERLDVYAHLQRVPWDTDRAMLLTLRTDDDGQRDDEPGKDHDQHERDDEGSDNDGPGIHNGSGDTTNADSPRIASVTPLRPVADTDVARNGAQGSEAFGGLGAEDLRGILDTATDGVIILSDKGIVRAVNRSAEALFDVNASAVIEQSFTKILAQESHRSAMDYLSSLTGTGIASLLNDGREVIGKTATGGLIPLFMTIGKLENTDACCVVMRDITQWKKAEEELVTAKAQAEQASAQKSEFLAKVSHEIRTPLNAIIGFSDMMIEERFGKIDNDRYRGYLRDIHRSGNHVLELINDLLDISKIEAGKMDLEFDACDLNTTISETVALTQPDANKERVIIRTSLSAVVPKVVADPRSLRQIILNLVSNSIKYTKAGGQVIVSTVYEESGEVVLRVRDTGIGMSEIELAKALRPFQQINSESDTQGTGLGLPLTKAMVEANRAQFHIESKPEEGTLVEVHFPTQRVLADR